MTNPKPPTLIPKPKIRNPQTLNPKPHTLSLKAGKQAGLKRSAILNLPESLKQDGLALRHASDELRNDWCPGLRVLRLGSVIYWGWERLI